MSPATLLPFYFKTSVQVSFISKLNKMTLFDRSEFNVYFSIVIFFFPDFGFYLGNIECVKSLNKVLNGLNEIVFGRQVFIVNQFIV